MSTSDITLPHRRSNGPLDAGGDSRRVDSGLQGSAEPGQRHPAHAAIARCDVGASSSRRAGAVLWWIRVARWSCAVLAVHLVVDAFVDTRPGTSPSDHLVSGTVPLVLVALVSVAIGRVRAGAAALMAILLGVAVAIGAGGGPGAALLAGRANLTAVTGAVAGCAGVVLLAAAGALLVRTRDGTGRRWPRWRRRVLRGLLAAALVFFVSIPTGMGFVITNRSGSVSATGDLGQPHVEVTLRTTDGLALSAAYVPSVNGAAVIVFPGRSSPQTTSRARMLSAHGYGVLVLDQRGLGGSEGDPNLLGWTGESDLRAAIRYLRSRPDVDPDRVGGLGLSVGGELLIQTAAHDEGLRAVVSEGAGTRWVAEDHAPMPLALVAAPFSAMMTAATAVFGDAMPPARLEDLIGDVAPRPVMLVWTRRGIGGEHMNPRYHASADGPATLWEIPESTHVDGLATRPDEYERRVVGFFDDALAPRS